jgi:geranylgeranyl reductase family protein
MISDCDAVIVGGGPAGSTCARHLSRAGYDVVVLDRAVFPRDKPCAGWITPAVVDALELPLDRYARGRVLQRITGFRTGLIGEAGFDTQFDETVSYGIRRREFDTFLLERSGARVSEGEALASLHRDGGRWIVNDRLSTPLVIGAGGHFCPVARHVAGSQREPVVVAREIEFALEDPESCAVEADRPELYFARDLKGYGWCFRKEGVLNVGLGRQDPHALSGHVDEFVAWLQNAGRLPTVLPGPWKGHAYLLAGESTRPVVEAGLLLVGDAAGLAYPASGEGIRPAVESAILAARTVIDARGKTLSREVLAPYATAITRRFGRPHLSPHRLVGQRTAEWLAALVLRNRWLTRHFFLPRVFLQPGPAALLANAAAEPVRS